MLSISYHNDLLQIDAPDHLLQLHGTAGIMLTISDSKANYCLRPTTVPITIIIMSTPTAMPL